MGRYAYTPEQNAWLAEHFPIMTNRELAEAFEERFGEPVTACAMSSWGSNHHMRKKPGVRSRANRKYTDEQLDFLREAIPGRSLSQVNEMYEARFGVRLTRSALRNLRTKLGVHCGVNSGRFRKGQEPQNKGRPWSEWMPEESREGCRRTQFRKGELNGVAKERYHDLLYVRETEDGYLEIKVSPRNEKHAMQRWIPLGAFEWMKANGRDWPDGCRCVHADRNPKNCDADNIVPVPIRLWPLVNGANPSSLPWHDKETLEAAVLSARISVRRSDLMRERRMMRERRRMEGREWACDAGR